MKTWLKVLLGIGFVHCINNCRRVLFYSGMVDQQCLLYCRTAKDMGKRPYFTLQRILKASTDETALTEFLAKVRC